MLTEGPGVVPPAARGGGAWRRLGLAMAAVAGLLAAAPAALAHDWIYTVRPGDNLWDLAERHLKSMGYWRALQRHNGIGEPRRLPPGSRLRIPVRWLKVQPASARLVQAVGEVRRQAETAPAPAPVAPGAELVIGDRLLVPEGASATVEFADGSRLLVQPGSELELDEMSAYGVTGMVDTSLRLRRGRVESDVRPAAGPGSRYRITTPAAVAAVRGTGFRVGFDPAAETALNEVTRGRVAVAGAGVARDVAAGFGVVARRGAPPEPPRPLLPAPDLGALPARAERLLIELEWPALQGAAAYRVQLYAGDDPATLLLEKRVRAPRAELDAPPDGGYLLRVRGIDGAGLEGLDADRRLTVDARPVPPAPLRPADGSAMHGAAPELWWSAPEGAVAYRLQLARGEAFTDPLIDEARVEATRYRPGIELAPGIYRWRLASIAANGEQGPFGDPWRFRMQAIPEPPKAGESTVGEGEVRLTWGRAADAVRYRFQLARDEGFADPLVDEDVEERAWVLKDPGAGTYYFRARGISAEGVAGPFGPVSRFEVPAKPWPPWLILLAFPLLLL